MTKGRSNEDDRLTTSERQTPSPVDGILERETIQLSIISSILYRNSHSLVWFYRPTVTSQQNGATEIKHFIIGFGPAHYYMKGIRG